MMLMLVWKITSFRLSWPYPCEISVTVRIMMFLLLIILTSSPPINSNSQLGTDRIEYEDNFRGLKILFQVGSSGWVGKYPD